MNAGCQTELKLYAKQNIEPLNCDVYYDSSVAFISGSIWKCPLRDVFELIKILDIVCYTFSL